MWEIIVLVIGFIFGFIFGWLFRDWRSQDQEWAMELQRSGIGTGGDSETLRTELAAARSELQSSSAQRTQCERELESLRQRLQEREATISTLESRSGSTAGSGAQMASAAAPIRDMDGGSSAAQPGSAVAGAPQPTAPAGPSGQTAPGDGGKDDLKKIKGIGPVLERLLNEQGITAFAQIARFNDADIERVAEGIQSFPDRIRRDEWIQQAKALHHAKYGEHV